MDTTFRVRSFEDDGSVLELLRFEPSGAVYVDGVLVAGWAPWWVARGVRDPREARA